MTSVQRNKDNIYGSDKEPKYNIISYTWGRWRISNAPDSQRIRIHGTPWQIPAVDPSHFTVAELEATLKTVAGSLDYVWIDIACINQGTSPDDIAEGMDQIGKQAAIFRKAHRAYIWIGPSTTDNLEQVLTKLYEDSSQLQTLDKQFKKPNAWTNVLKPWSKHKVGLLNMPKKQMMACFNSISDAVDKIYGNPWFTSLWTLQESVLRRDAMLLSRSGVAIQQTFEDNVMPFRLSMLGLMFYSLCNHITWLLELAELDQATRSMATNLNKKLESNGMNIMFCSNPNIPLGLARSRTTTRKEDQIYGIMQVYGFRLGKASEPYKSFDLKALEQQLGMQLVKEDVLLSQLFVHEATPVPGASWRITQRSTVPYFGYIYERPKTLDPANAKIDVGRTGAVVSGFSWPLQSMIAAVDSYISNVNDGANAIDIYLDHDYRMTRPLRKRATIVDRLGRNQNRGELPLGGLKLGRVLVQVYSEARVVYFGKSDELTYIGLIIIPEIFQGSKIWTRIGLFVCSLREFRDRAVETWKQGNKVIVPETAFPFFPKWDKFSGVLH